MYPDNALFVILPLGLYLGLVLPAELGHRASVAALGATVLFLLASVGAPRAGGQFLDRELQALFAGTLTGAAAGAVACHWLARRRSGTWVWRAAGFGIGALVMGLIHVVLIMVL